MPYCHKDLKAGKCFCDNSHCIWFYRKTSRGCGTTVNTSWWSADVPHSPCGLVWDVRGPPACIYGRPTSEASFPFIIYRFFGNITPRNDPKTPRKNVNRLDWAHVVPTYAPRRALQRAFSLAKGLWSWCSVTQPGEALNIDKNKQNQALVVRGRRGRPRTTLKSLITSEISVLTQQTTTRRPWRTFWALTLL